MPRPGPVEPRIDGPVRRVHVDLGIALERESTVALPDQLEHALRGMMSRGELAAGARLPSSRVLAEQLGVSRGIVVEAYDRLRRQGALQMRQGAAVRVADGVEALASTSPSIPGQQPEYDLRLHAALVPPATFDRRAWRVLLRRALNDASDADLRSIDRCGHRELRGALAEQLARSRGVTATAEHVVVTNGVTHALMILAPLLRGRGPVAVEDPGFLVHRATLAGAACDVVPIPTDAHGIDVEALATSGARSVLVTPAHQMPLGNPLAADRRRTLLRWARETDALVIEDDYDGELRYDRRSVRALQGLDPDRVLYLGTTSKVLSPAIRIGWIVVPTAQLEGVRVLARIAQSSPGTVDQHALALALRTGEFDRSVARLRRRCATQRAALAAAVGEALPGLTIEGVEAGLSFTLRAPGVDATTVIAAAAARRIELFALQHGDDALLVVGFGDVHESRATQVATQLTEIIAAVAEP